MEGNKVDTVTENVDIDEKSVVDLDHALAVVGEFILLI